MTSGRDRILQGSGSGPICMGHLQASDQTKGGFWRIGSEARTVISSCYRSGWEPGRNAAGGACHKSEMSDMSERAYLTMI